MKNWRRERGMKGKGQLYLKAREKRCYGCGSLIRINKGKQRKLRIPQTAFCSRDCMLKYRKHRIKEAKEMKCEICEREVKLAQDYTIKPYWFINGAILGDYIKLRGHRNCLENINAKVVIPNRLRLLKLREVK